MGGTRKRYILEVRDGSTSFWDVLGGTGCTGS